MPSMMEACDVKNYDSTEIISPLPRPHVRWFKLSRYWFAWVICKYMAAWEDRFSLRSWQVFIMRIEHMLRVPWLYTWVVWTNLACFNLFHVNICGIEDASLIETGDASWFLWRASRWLSWIYDCIHERGRSQKWWTMGRERHEGLDRFGHPCG
jgi:hypothetical protein